MDMLTLISITLENLVVVFLHSGNQQLCFVCDILQNATLARQHPEKAFPNLSGEGKGLAL